MLIYHLFMDILMDYNLLLSLSIMLLKMDQSGPAEGPPNRRPPSLSASRHSEMSQAHLQ